MFITLENSKEEIKINVNWLKQLHYWCYVYGIAVFNSISHTSP